MLKAQTYIVDAEVPFLWSKQTLESWNFNIWGPQKMLEIHIRSGDDHDRNFLKMIVTAGGHYGIVLESRKEDTGTTLDENDLSVLFMVNYVPLKL